VFSQDDRTDALQLLSNDDSKQPFIAMKIMSSSSARKEATEPLLSEEERKH